MKRRSFLKFTGLSAAGAYLSTKVQRAAGRSQSPSSPARESAFTNAHGWTTVVRPDSDYELRSGDDVITCACDMTLTLPPVEAGRMIYIVPANGAVVTMLGQRLTSTALVYCNGQRWHLVGATSTNSSASSSVEADE